MYLYMYEFLADNEEQVLEFSPKFNRRNQQSGSTFRSVQEDALDLEPQNSK